MLHPLPSSSCTLPSSSSILFRIPAASHPYLSLTVPSPLSLHRDPSDAFPASAGPLARYGAAVAMETTVRSRAALPLSPFGVASAPASSLCHPYSSRSRGSIDTAARCAPSKTHARCDPAGRSKESCCCCFPASHVSPPYTLVPPHPRCHGTPARSLLVLSPRIAA